MPLAIRTTRINFAINHAQTVFNRFFKFENQSTNHKQNKDISK